MAGCTHSSVKVYLNGKKLPVADFKSYVDLFLGPKQAADAVPRVFEKVGDRWEVAVAASEDGFAQVSFVNSIATSKGGTHVNHVADQVVDRVLEHLKKKHKVQALSLTCFTFNCLCPHSFFCRIIFSIAMNSERSLTLRERYN